MIGNEMLQHYMFVTLKGILFGKTIQRVMIHFVWSLVGEKGYAIIVLFRSLALHRRDCFRNWQGNCLLFSWELYGRYKFSTRLFICSC